MTADESADKRVTANTELVEPPPPPAPFRVTAWNGLPLWECARCAFDTLEGEEAMLAHIAGRHESPPEPPAPRLVQVYDRWGNPV